MDSLIEFVNGLGSTVSGTVTTLLTLNYVVGNFAVSVILYVAQTLTEAVFTLAKALVVVLDDFASFIRDIWEAMAAVCALTVDLADTCFEGVHLSVLAVKAAIVGMVRGVGNAFTATVTGVYTLSNNFGHFLNLLCSSFVLLISLIPRTIVYLSTLCYNGVKAGLQSVASLIHRSWIAFTEAPFEAVIGFVAAALLVYSTVKMAKKFVRERQITRRHVAVWTFKAVCLAYMFVIKTIICSVKGLARTIEFTLCHLHVPRFHGGDSDEEDEAETVNPDDEVIPAEVIDDTDDEEIGRLEQRRRNYDILVQRRNDKRRSRSKSKPKAKKAENGGPGRAGPAGGSAGGGEDVEEMLFEQVEREREDKLCVICQDQEKCVMILPCRHLCICIDCQGRLLRRNNQSNREGTCPICRKNVKQMIKAYL